MWNLLVVDPMTNALLLIYSLVGDFGLAIILFTLVVRLITHPLTVTQLKSTQAMQDLQKSPKFLEMQAKYKDDKEKLNQETLRLYQEAGINPAGSCLPMLIQLPVIFGLYQAIIAALATSPLQLVTFLSHIYSFFPNVAELLPLDSKFLWMDLGIPERLPLFGIGIPVLAILVTITTYLQTKLTMPQSSGGNDQSAMMGKMMGIYMPLLIGWLSFSFPAGLALYFFTSNVFGIAQYAAMGKVDWRNLLPGGSASSKTEQTGNPATKAARKPKKAKAK